MREATDRRRPRTDGGEVDRRVERALNHDVVQKRPSLVGVLRRGEYGAAGRMRLALGRVGRDDAGGAGPAARKLSDTVEALRQRSGEVRTEAHERERAERFDGREDGDNP